MFSSCPCGFPSGFAASSHTKNMHSGLTGNLPPGMSVCADGVCVLPWVSGPSVILFFIFFIFLFPVPDIRLHQNIRNQSNTGVRSRNTVEASRWGSGTNVGPIKEAVYGRTPWFHLPDCCLRHVAWELGNCPSARAHLLGYSAHVIT